MKRAGPRTLVPILVAAAVGAIVVAFEGPRPGAAPVADRPAAAPATVRPARPRSEGRPASRRAVAGSEARDPGLLLPRRPVLLVPGWLDTERDLAALRIRFIAAGWPDDWVDALSFEDPTGGNREHADELRRAALRLLDQTGADTLDIVAHSMGGLATRWYLLRGDPVPVRSVAFIATPHGGTMAAHLAWGEGRDEMLPESPFLDTLNRSVPVPKGVRAITVRTPIDTHVIPGESAALPGVPDHEVCCPTHAGLPDDPEVFGVVLRFLEGRGNTPTPPSGP
jgi:triacylglycerol lipase